MTLTCRVSTTPNFRRQENISETIIKHIIHKNLGGKSLVQTGAELRGIRPKKE